MKCISINYRNADEKLRGAFAFSTEMQRNLSDEIVMSCNVSEIVILCTCNRTEIYFCGGSEEKIIKMLSLYSDISISIIKQISMIFCGRSAVSHLFRVACGVESIVIGEDEILGQTRNAYLNACKLGYSHHETNVVFQAALACAKKIKTETALSNVSVSTATLAANKAAESGKNILVIGASGKIGQSTVKNLLSHKNINVTVTIRSHSPDMLILSDSKVKAVPYSDRYDHIDNADCVISATTSPHYTITLSELEKNLHLHKKRVFIDLAVPNDIDRDIAMLDNITLFGIDYFQILAHDNNIKKAHSAELAKKFIEIETDETEKSLALQKFLAEGYNINDKKMLYKLRSELSAKQFTAVLNVLKQR